MDSRSTDSVKSYSRTQSSGENANNEYEKLCVGIYWSIGSLHYTEGQEAKDQLREK